VLGEDSRAIVRAASAASKAADYLLAFRDQPATPARQGHTTQETLREIVARSCDRVERPHLSPRLAPSPPYRGRGGKGIS